MPERSLLVPTQCRPHNWQKQPHESIMCFKFRHPKRSASMLLPVDDCVDWLYTKYFDKFIKFCALGVVMPPNHKDRNFMCLPSLPHHMHMHLKHNATCPRRNMKSHVALSKYEQHDQLKAEASGPLRWPKLKPCGGTFAPFPTQKVDLTEDAHCMILDLSSLSEEEWKP